MSRLILSICLMILAVTSPARTVRDLYQVNIPVIDYQSATVDAAIKEGLAKVLEKVSGKAAVIALNQMHLTNKQVEHLVQAYSVIHPQQKNASDSEKPQSMQLHITFAKKAIHGFLNYAQQAVWGEPRPLVMVWLLRRNKLINEEQNPEVINEIKAIAKLRAIPIMFPVLDLTMMQSINDASSTPMVNSILLDASKNYDSDAIMIVHMHQNEFDQWEAHYLLSMADARMTWDTASKHQLSALNEGMTQLADTLALRYAQHATQDNIHTAVKLTIIGVNDADAFAKIQHYLSALSVVADVQLVNMDNDNMQFSLNLIADQEALAQQLSFDKYLEPTSPNSWEDESTLEYRLAS